jgi:tRNA(Ile)-lysidine synthase
VHSLAERFRDHITAYEFLRAGDRVGVAVSGGIDSIALLRLLLESRGELGIVVAVVHFNHKLRGAESETDERFVASLAQAHDLEFYVDSSDVSHQAAEQQNGLEAAAREIRYGFFRHLLGEGSDSKQLDKIATGHTLDDQAETVLMRLIRGSGLRGLAAIYPRIVVENEDGDEAGEMIRPLLPFRRHELKKYLEEIKQPWREDSSNQQTYFTRNRIRKLVIPLLEKEFNPAIAENLAELAEIARGEEDYWDNEVSGWMGTAVHWVEPDWVQKLNNSGLVQIGLPGQPSLLGAEADLRQKVEDSPTLVMNASLDRIWFVGEPAAVQRRVIRAIGHEAGIPLEFKHIEKILSLASDHSASASEMSLPMGWKLTCQPHELLFVTPDLREPIPIPDYSYELVLPGAVNVPEIATQIIARAIPAESAGEYNPDHLLNADVLRSPLQVRNWRAGDRFHPAHTKSAKKVKEFLQERHLDQHIRRLWPVILSGDEIVWLKGFSVSSEYRWKPGKRAVQILEHALAAEE